MKFFLKFISKSSSKVQMFLQKVWSSGALLHCHQDGSFLQSIPTQESSLEKCWLQK